MKSFDKHSLKLQALSEEKYPLCDKKLRDAIPVKNIGNWTQVEYSVASGMDVEKIMPYLAKIVLYLLTKDNKLEFLSYSKMRSVAILQPITIDSRILVRFHRDINNPLLGSNYVVLNVDSEKKLVHFKYGEDDGILAVDP